MVTGWSVARYASVVCGTPTGKMPCYEPAFIIGIIIMILLIIIIPPTLKTMPPTGDEHEKPRPPTNAKRKSNETLLTTQHRLTTTLHTFLKWHRLGNHAFKYEMHSHTAAWVHTYTTVLSTTAHPPTHARMHTHLNYCYTPAHRRPLPWRRRSSLAYAPAASARAAPCGNQLVGAVVVCYPPFGLLRE